LRFDFPFLKIRSTGDPIAGVEQFQLHIARFLGKCMIFYFFILINKLSTTYDTLQLRTYFHSTTSDASKKSTITNSIPIPHPTRTQTTYTNHQQKKRNFCTKFCTHHIHHPLIHPKISHSEERLKYKTQSLKPNTPSPHPSPTFPLSVAGGGIQSEESLSPHERKGKEKKKKKYT
jgi:hypothetical protein